MESYINSLLGAEDSAENAEADLEVAGDQLEIMARPLLPFPFARRSGAYVLMEGAVMTLYHRESISVSVISEIQRYLGKPFVCRRVPEKDFETRLTEAYESRNNETMQMVEGLGATVTTEKQPFEPEGGAYGGRSGGHHHHH